jgi:hypothetical protein
MLKIREKDEEIVVRTQYSSHAPLVVMEWTRSPTPIVTIAGCNEHSKQ